MNILLMGMGAYVLVMLILGALMVTGIYFSVRTPKSISQSRRQFLGGNSANDEERALFFGIQIAIQVFGSDALRAQLARRVEAEDQTDTAEETRRFIKSVAALLTENQ